MENKDNKKSFTKFLKKQGFYIALFVCLSVIAVVAAVTTNNTKNDKKVAMNEAVTSKEARENQKINAKQTEEGSLSQRNKKINNAVEVKNNSKQKKNINKSEVSVSKVSDAKFIKPVEGKVVMKYSETPIWWEISKSYRPNFGINIKSKVGTNVNAVANGEVKKIDAKGSFGTTIVIYHPESGKTSVYGNLDKRVKVKKGDKVTQGQQIGTIGKTSLRGMSQEVGNDFLHFEILKKSDGDPQFSSENPEKYIKY
ncbi:M23 family metallopeptidase [Clostridium botulinum]|uniref:Membrane protein n=1 Tax=Clostridium botulinum TaxID=1491 RepID=A0A9Q1UWC3_CLOBO|nr:M23 family metallopeptidase [Clostridium botulinum]AEB76923.1 conserved membrane-associated protein [Clostridium botulinum BKT015925]KEH98357.1 membrane protein [Clostridium botulinum D str. 16868]KEI05098.1 membrane protein [Clostridium botulinum C/D str. Sp77]KLU75372.1 membrane protein [Clostridium botulinum V891]KOA76228.1 membrane protein [Clostridium botulinum]